jgi:hypothetical protein
MTVDYLGWTLDFSCLQMLCTLRLISAAFNISDGDRLKKNPDFLQFSKHKELAVSSMPSILEYFGYVYFFPVTFC